MADAVEHGHGHEDGHHDPNLQHHFENLHQQFDASKLGMWLFLVTEILFFAGLFCAYAYYRRTHPQIFDVGQHFLDVKMGAINTAILITSSFTMALGVWCAQKSYQRGLVVCLVLTLAGAFGFMVVKYFEYEHKIHTGKVWGKNFLPLSDAEAHGHHGDEHHGDGDHADDAHAAGHAAAGEMAGDHADSGEGPHGSDGNHADDNSHADDEGPDATGLPSPQDTEPTFPADLKVEASTVPAAAAGPGGLAAAATEQLSPEELAAAEEAALYERARQMRDLQIFMGIYYCMTGLHGIHVLAGIAVISWLLVGAIKGRYNSHYYTPVDLVGLYWHVVDLVWIFLFPLFYLID